MWGQGSDYIGQSAMMNNLASLVGQQQAAQFQADIFNNYIASADFRAISAYGLNVARLPFNYKLLEDDANPFVYKQSGWNVLDHIVNAAKAKQTSISFPSCRRRPAARTWRSSATTPDRPCGGGRRSARRGWSQCGRPSQPAIPTRMPLPDTTRSVSR